MTQRKPVGEGGRGRGTKKWVELWIHGEAEFWDIVSRPRLARRKNGYHYLNVDRKEPRGKNA